MSERIVPMYLAGRCVNGSERDCGIRYHAIIYDEQKNVLVKVLCGASAGRRSAGWRSDKDNMTSDHNVNCPRCLKALRKYNIYYNLQARCWMKSGQGSANDYFIKHHWIAIVPNEIDGDITFHRKKLYGVTE